MRIGGEAATDAQGEAHFAPAVAMTGGSGEADVVDFRIGAPVAAAGDGNFKFAREIVKLGVAAELAVDFQRERRCVDNFLAVEPRERAAGNVAGHVAAGSGSGEARFPESLQEVGQRLDGDPMQLNILAHGDVRDAAAVFFREARDGADLFAAQEAVGNANTHHEKRQGLAFAVFAAGHAEAVALGVNAPGTEIGAGPFRGDGIETVAGELLNLVEMVPGVLGALEALDALGLGFHRFWFRDFSHGSFTRTASLKNFRPKTKNPRSPGLWQRGLRNF